MPKRVLAIGVGGSGTMVLTALKERLEEAYGQVPDNVALLEFDTDSLRAIDTFAGTRLSETVGQDGREPEFQQITSPPGMTMDTVFADITRGRTSAYMHWLQMERLQRILSPADNDIRGGSQQRRPIGRTALFLSWSGPIIESITDAIGRIYGEPDVQGPVDAIDVERGKRLIFLVGSVAGGTGSGFLIDVANLVRHVVRQRPQWQSVDVSAIIVLPDAFRVYVPHMEDPTNLKPNSYAALRELDRFNRVHSAALPYPIRYGQDIRSITWSTAQLFDHVFLVDIASRSATQDFDLGGDPRRGVFPVIADFIMAHIDTSLGDALAALRANAGQHFDKETGRMYSGFNVMTYIFPVNDVIESFSYRFLREMLARQFLPIADNRTRAIVEQDAVKETELVFSENSVGGRVNPGVIQKAIACTRRMEPEIPDVSWPGLFNLIAVSESVFAEDYQDLEQSLAYLSSILIPTKEGEYRGETYDQGYARLQRTSEQFMDDYLGPKSDPDDEESRSGGEWDRILGRYRDSLRQRWAEALDAAILEVLDRRDPTRATLQPGRLPYARAMVACLKDKLTSFKALLAQQYRQQQIDARIRQTSEQLRDAITWMYQTKDKRPLISVGKPEPRRAQDSYIGLFTDKMALVLHQRIYRTVVDVLDALGAAERDTAGQVSVLDAVAQELENWQATFQDVDRILRDKAQAHEAKRAFKRRVRVRRYLTNPQFENQLYGEQQISGAVAAQVLGQARGVKGLVWKRLEETEPLSYKLVTTWGENARGAEQIASQFFAGIKELFQVVRQNVNIADRVAAEFSSPASFTNTALRVAEPFLRYNRSANDGRDAFSEQYVSLNLDRAADDARGFLEQGVSTLADQGFTVDTNAESLVACTVVEVARGIRLGAVDQFTACETDYRFKLYMGRESIHLFPEEQTATDYEQRIEMLGEPSNRLRALAPELVVAMGDEAKLRAFTLACAYGLVEHAMFVDPETHEESTEMSLTLRQDGRERSLTLSRRRVVQDLDPRFRDVGPEEQLARLYLNALQNFVLKATELRGVPPQMVPALVEGLQGRGVSLGHIENPLTLALRDVNEAIQLTAQGLGPDRTQEPDTRRRNAINARRRIDHYLRPFLEGRVEFFKRSPVARVRDMGTVMHLILKDEINALHELAAGVSL